MKAEDQFLEFVQWDKDDGVYVGFCPDLFPWGGVCHRGEKEETYHQLCALIREEVRNLASIQGRASRKN